MPIDPVSFSFLNKMVAYSNIHLDGDTKNRSRCKSVHAAVFSCLSLVGYVCATCLQEYILMRSMLDLVAFHEKMMVFSAIKKEPPTLLHTYVVNKL